MLLAPPTGEPVPTSLSYLQNLYQTAAGDPRVSGYTSFLFHISPLLLAHQGETLRLRFAEVDNVFFFNLGVDDVSLEVNSAPEPRSLFPLGLLAISLILLRRRRPH